MDMSGHDMSGMNMSGHDMGGMNMSGHDMGGMDMGGMDMSMSQMPMSDMKMAFFGTVGTTTLWFDGWLPANKGATVGAVFGLFFLAVIYRAFATVRAHTEYRWARTTVQPEQEKGARVPYAPFNLQRDLTRALFELVQAFVAYLLMIAVMTMNTWFFIGILAGLAFGEFTFGRYTAALRCAGAANSYNEALCH